jgi:integrase
VAEKLLSDKQLRTVKAGDRELVLKDGGSLYARVRRMAAGDASITWQFYFKWDGKTERMSLGPYPEVSLLEARRRRDAARVQLKADPPEHPVLRARRVAAEAHAKALAEGREKTVRGLFEDWQTVYLRHHHKDGGARALEYFEYDVFPLLGNRRARAVTRTDISTVIDQVVARGARRKANAILAQLKQLFAHGVVRGLVDADPTYGFSRKHAGGKEYTRERVLAPVELADLAGRLPTSGLSEPYQAAVRFLLATGARVGELNQALWAHVDLAAPLWRIPKENTKNGREHLVHLSAFAREQLDVLGRFRSNAWVIPSRKADLPVDDKAISKALRDRQREYPLKGRTKASATLKLEGGDWSPHDLRRTFATRLADLGVMPHVIERCLNHTMQGVMAVYNRHDYLQERREALDLWGAELGRIFAPRLENIVDMIPSLTIRRRIVKK